MLIRWEDKEMRGSRWEAWGVLADIHAQDSILGGLIAAITCTLRVASIVCSCRLLVTHCTEALGRQPTNGVAHDRMNNPTLA